jgi:hypothetical protein
MRLFIGRSSVSPIALWIQGYPSLNVWLLNNPFSTLDSTRSLDFAIMRRRETPEKRVSTLFSEVYKET